MTLFDFSQADAVAAWRSIDDTVMGGLSASRFDRTEDGNAAFRGEVSLENNGGFASVRSLPERRDLGAYAGIRLRVRGDGRRYKLNLKTDDAFDGVLYRAAFETARDRWETIELPFERFEPTFRGRVVPSAGPLDPSNVVSFGLMISDKQEGPFRLELSRIEAYED